MLLHLLFVLFAAATCLGQSLVPLSSPTTESLRGIRAVSASVMWASGTHGTYLRTTNGGTTWDAAQVPGAEKLDFRDVEAFSADEAYLLSAGSGDQSRIYKTIDGGKHWTLQFENTDDRGFYDCMAFWDHTHGIALGDPVNQHFELLATEDGGSHWAALPENSRPLAKDGEGAFAASGTCITVQKGQNVWFATGGTAARIFHSTNRGKTWTAAETPLPHGVASAGIFSIAFRDARHGIIVGGDYQRPEQDGVNLAVTDDAGATWKAVPIHLPFFFSAVTYLSEAGSRVLALGTARVAEFDLDQKTVVASEPTSLNAVSCIGPGKAMGVGAKGRIARWSSAPRSAKNGAR